MSASPRAERWSGLLTAAAFLGVLVATLALASPLWRVAPDRTWGGTRGDPVAVSWYFDWVARSEDLERFGDLGYPDPPRRVTQFPLAVDAQLLRPLVKHVDPPRHINAVNAVWVVLAGLGAAVLAWGAGARNLGIVWMGVHSAALLHLWRELHRGTLNAAEMGFALAATGLWLACGRHRWPLGLPLALAAATCGALAVGTYPLALVPMIPVGLSLGVKVVREADWPARALMAAAPLLALALSWPWLESLVQTQSGRLGICYPPIAGAALDPGLLLRWTPLSSQSQVLGGVAGSTVLLAPLVFLRRRPWAAALLLPIAGLLVLSSLGPGGSGLVGELRRELACQARYFTDLHRAATGGVLIALLLGGLGLEALPRRLGRWGWALGTALLLAGLGHAAWLLSAEQQRADRWSSQAEPVYTAWLREHPGPGVELPFEDSATLLSVLHHNQDSPRVNPFEKRPPERGRAQQPLGWFWTLGVGAEHQRERPTVEVLRATGLRWVLWDGGRCPDAGAEACSWRNRAELVDLLGPAEEIAPGVLAWSLE